MLFLALGVAGCACPRYDVQVTSVPLGAGRADWVAVRIDRQTGQTWYSYNQGTDVASQRPQWHPILGGVELPK